MEQMRFMSVELLVGYIHLSKSSIYKMVRTNEIPHIKKGTRTLFDREQIDKWMLGGTSDELPTLTII